MREKIRYYISLLSFGFSKRKVLYSLLITFVIILGASIIQVKGLEIFQNREESKIKLFFQENNQNTDLSDPEQQTASEKDIRSSKNSSISSSDTTDEDNSDADYNATEETASSDSSNNNDTDDSSSENLPTESPSAIVAFYADNQSDTDAEDENHRRVVNAILNTSANPVFHAGDLMEDGTQASLDRFNNIAGPLLASRTFYGSLGNNDRKVGDSTTPSQLYLDNFSFPGNERWYSVNVGNLHMVILDSAFASGSQEQIDWLVSDLQSAASQSRITGVIFHHPTFINTISSYLINNGVDFVVSGHYHSYSHTSSSGMHIFVTTGQPSIGYLLAKIYSDSVNLTVYNNNNTVRETINFNER